MRARRRLLALVATLAVTTGTAGACTSANGTEGKSYVAGDDAVVVEIPPGDRGDPVEVSGDTLTGEPLDLADRRGSVVVVNVWWSGCPPCRVEAPMLVDASDELAGDGTIVGINVRDSSRDNGVAFERSFGVPYPSLYDPGSETLLDFPAPYNPRDMPSTMVLDREGRVAALVRGELPSKRTLLDLVEKVAGESSDG